MNKDLLSMGLEFTQTYKKYKDAHPYVREIMCLKTIFPNVLGDIKPGDMFAGKDNNYGPIGFVPEGAGRGHGVNGFTYYCDEGYLDEVIKKTQVSEETLKKLNEAREFWKTENTTYKVRNAYSEKLAKVLSSDDYINDPGIGFPLYRMGGIYLNYEKLVKYGVVGLQRELNKYLNNAEENSDARQLYTAMSMALDLFVEVCEYYAKQAKEMGNQELADTLIKITVSKPETLREAIQLVWLYIIVSADLNYGRMDVFLGDFYCHDIDSGLITEEEAINMVTALWKMIAEKRTVWNGRVVIGGKGRVNEANADRFALAAIEATRRVKDCDPQLTLRFYKGMNPELMEKALVAIGEGRTYPMLYNDDINVDAVMRAFNVSEDEALQYVPFGCGEYVLDHRSIGTPSGVINLAKALEVTLHNGKDPMTGKTIGLQTGEFENFKSYAELFDAYKKQVTYYVDALAEQEELEYNVVSEIAPHLFISILFDSCLEKGKGVFGGGAKYLGGTLETYGNTNTADSLAAIKNVVFDKKLITPKRLVEALDANFEGYEKERSLLLNAPKFGNDDSFADEVAMQHHNFVCNVIRDQKNRTGLHSYLAVIINNDTNTKFGHMTLASADGRKAGTPLANANMPSAGSDKNGVTAVMNSQVKLNPALHAGSVQNMKFSRDLFTGSSQTVKALLGTYFDRGGTQAMITVVNRGDLENAMKEPEKYKNLFVRVGGFSARFVELAKDVQLEILSRTLY